jgi:hypothetical protein
VVFEESLYDASLGDLLLIVRGLDGDEDTVLLLGHDPSVSALVTDLTGTPTRLRTCGVAVARVPRPWPDTPPGGCELVAAETPGWQSAVIHDVRCSSAKPLHREAESSERRRAVSVQRSCSHGTGNGELGEARTAAIPDAHAHGARVHIMRAWQSDRCMQSGP